MLIGQPGREVPSGRRRSRAAGGRCRCPS